MGRNFPKRPSKNLNLLFVIYFLYRIVPALIGGLAIYLGYRLFIMGVTGQASLSVDSKNISGQLLNAAPGLFFAVGGIVVLVVSAWRAGNIEFETDAPSSRTPVNRRAAKSESSKPGPPAQSGAS